MAEHFEQSTDLPVINDNIPKVDIRREGDFYISKIELISHDGKVYGLELLRLEASIFEDIFSNVMSGEMHFQDSSDLTQFLPLIGEEKIKFTFTRPDESGRGLLDDFFSREFRVYKLENRRPETERFNIQNYTLHFVSAEKIKDSKQKVWKTFKAMPYHEMVEKIYNEFLKIDKPIVVEPTMYDFDFAASGMSPFQIISLLASKSISAEGNGSAYVLYEDMDKFNFVSIGKLLKQASTSKYVSQMSNVLKDQGSVKQRDRNIESDIYRVENYSFSGAFDILGRLQNGMYSQRLWTVDTLRQIWDDKIEYHHKAEFKKQPHLHKDDICTDKLDALNAPNSVLRLVETTKDHDKVPHIVAREPGIKPNHIEEFLLIRAAQLEQTLGNRMHVNVSGDPRRRAGQVVEFKVPNHYGALDKYHLPDPPHDRYMSGKHLITALKHRIQADRYYNEFEFLKDSLAQTIEGVDIIEQQDFSW